MKTREELDALTAALEKLNTKLAGLTKEELANYKLEADSLNLRLSELSEDELTHVAGGLSFPVAAMLSSLNFSAGRRAGSTTAPAGHFPA